MNLEYLVQCDESDWLDFKRQQYPFEKTSDDEKSELLKDILAMANSWRTQTAYILIGIDDSVYPHQATNLYTHIDDSNLQQFITSKIEGSFNFKYYRKTLSGQMIGVFEIPLQHRPKRLKKNFGKVQSNKVYVRRGSSTVEANDEEIARMIALPAPVTEVDIGIQLAKHNTREIIGNTMSIHSKLLQLNEENDIQDYCSSEEYLSIGSTLENRDYYRDLVKYEKLHNLLSPIAFSVTNRGRGFASQIRVELSLNDPERKWQFVEEKEYPDDLPSADSIMNISNVCVRTSGPYCDIEYTGDTWYLSFEINQLSAGQTLWPCIVAYAGAKESGTAVLEGLVYAKEVSSPVPCCVEINADVSEEITDLDSILDKHLGKNEEQD